MLIDLIRGGTKTKLQPLNKRQSEANSLPIFLACRALHHPYPRAFCTLPSFARIKRPRWRPVGLNDRHLRSNRKIGDCEQSNNLFNIFNCWQSLNKEVNLQEMLHVKTIIDDTKRH